MDSKCGICLEAYTKKTRVKVVCQYCPVGACKICQQNYLLNTYDDPHCYSCKQGWNSDFMAASFPMIFRTKTLRFHRRKILLEREKSLLPAMQVFVEAKKSIATVGALTAEVFSRYRIMTQELQRIRVKCYATKIQLRVLWDKSQLEDLTDEEQAESVVKTELLQKYVEDEVSFLKNEYRPASKLYRDTTRQMTYWTHVYETGEQQTGSEKKERRQFIMRCPAEDCRGFLSTAYKCGVCEKETCSACLEILTGGEHECKPDAVETAQMIKKETHPCPKCGVRIYKIDGCDQMWCTVDGCNTAFSWNTGAIVVGRVHNPHYYEWLRRKGGGSAPREAGDIPCGGIPDVRDFYRVLELNPSIPTATIKIIMEIHRNITELQERQRQFPMTPGALFNKDINVAYLMNELTEEGWMTALEHAEARFNRKRENGLIMQTLVIAASDILQMISRRATETENLETILGAARINAATADWALRCGDGTEAAHTEAQERYRKAFDDVQNITILAWLDNEILPNLESLRQYTNDSFEKLSRTTRMAVPQIGAKWNWVPIRAMYKRTKNEIVDAVVTVETMDAVVTVGNAIDAIAVGEW